MILDKPLEIQNLLDNEETKQQLITFVKTIDELASGHEGGNVSVAVTGDWGSGKTTILKSCQSYFSDYKNFPVVFYEAWKYQDEDPLLPLLLQISNLDEVTGNIKKKVTSIIKTTTAAGMTLYDTLVSGIKLGIGKTEIDGGELTFEKAISRGEKFMELLNKKYFDAASKRQENLEALSEVIQFAINGKHKYDAERKELWSNECDENAINLFNDKKFVILIDDLDRLLPGKAFKVIETIRFYFDIEDVIVIMGVNDELLEKYILGHYGINNSEHKKGEKFIDKIFHWQYELTSVKISPVHLRKLDDLIGHDNSNYVKDTLYNLDPLTHRKLIKIINKIEEKVLLANNTNITKSLLHKFIFEAVIYETFPEGQYLLRKLPGLVKELFDQTNDDEDGVKKVKEKFENDETYFEFPQRNFESLLESKEVNA